MPAEDFLRAVKAPLKSAEDFLRAVEAPLKPADVPLNSVKDWRNSDNDSPNPAIRVLSLITRFHPTNIHLYT